jgi:hypothetical protein
MALVACLAIGAAGNVGAATLGYTGTLTVSLIPQPWDPSPWDPTGPLKLNAAATGSGTSLVNGSGGGIHLNSLGIGAGAFGPFSTAYTWIGSSSNTINSVRFTGIANLTGSFGPGLSGGPPGGGAMGLTGLAKICLVFAPCQYAGIVVPLSPTTGGAGFGIGGTHLTTPISPFPVITLQHAPWTIGQPVMTIHSPNSNITAPVLPGGFAHGPASLTSSTARLSGVLQLVTVTKVFTSATVAFPEFPVVGVLTLHLVPEPGTLLLFGSGVAVLAVLGRRHARR